MQESGFDYTPKDGYVCIDKVTSPGSVVTIPAYVDGLPVRELGGYALAGSGVEEVFLPPYLERIGPYAFYGCKDLKAIHACGRLRDLGAGVFAGDKKIALLDICEGPGETSALKEMLSEIRQTLSVRLKSDGEGEARLTFPEYFEESVENTPARQLVYQMHGCGQRYRYSFTNRKLNFAEYDELFPYACNEADEEVCARLAIGRLRYPRELGAGAKETYERYLRGNWEAAARVLILADEVERVTTTNLEPESLPWLLEEIIHPDEEKLYHITDLARRAGDTAMVSYCMDRAHQSRDMASGTSPARRRGRFELL